MYANIQDTFLFVEQDKQVSYEDVDAGHGRVETRKCTVTGDLSHITRVDDWEKIQTLVRVESQRYIKATDVTQRETRYYISSLTPDPNQLEKVIRSHWDIENKRHWHLDVSFNEDKSRKRDRNAAENYSFTLRWLLIWSKTKDQQKEV